jgi:predicted nuclease with RNAse H fold
MILGIDPGVGKARCGFALISGGKLYHHRTVDGSDAVSYARQLHAVYKFDRCTIEVPQAGVVYARHSTKKNRVISEAGRIKLAMNIGQNIQLAHEIAAELRRIGVKIKEVRPARKATKWPAEYWKSVFNWSGRAPSEHARDASVHALQYENWAWWNL